MIQVKELASVATNFVVNVALDKLHRRMEGGFKKTDVTIKCGWSGNDIVLRIKNIKGQISQEIERKNNHRRDTKK